jgi:hypothetical protein
MFALDMVWQEDKIPQDDSYLPNDGFVIAWSLQVVKALLFKILFVLKVGTMEHNTWATMMGPEMALVHLLGDYVNVILKNFVV